MVSSLVQKSVAMKIQHESEAGSLAYLRYLLTGQFHLSRSVLSFAFSAELLPGAREQGFQASMMLPQIKAQCDVQMIRVLVQNTADVNLRCHGLEKICRQPSGHTPLMMAARCKQDPVVLSTLLELQADLTAASRFGAQVIHWVQTPGQVQVLANAGVDMQNLTRFRNPPLASVACWASFDTVKEMILHRCDVNPSNAGIHPLHVVAAFSKRQAAEKAQLLLEHRAEVDVQLSTAGTSIFACICHSSQIISYMYDFGSLSAATKLFGSLEGITPLGMAAFFGDHSLTRCLLEAGADRSIANARGDLPLMLANAQGHRAIVSELEGFQQRDKDQP
ncbi:unnamed protein product [Durusdinium trenchii]|uniref:Uncharacterized protein n=1 Tax=Durusdinium trenchii TaxID=1381693 RepID=A0ABP0MLD9_9DINO